VPDSSSNTVLAWVAATLPFMSAAFWGARKAVNFNQRLRTVETAIERGEQDRAEFMDSYKEDRKKDELARQQVAVLMDRTNLILKKLDK